MADTPPKNPYGGGGGGHTGTGAKPFYMTITPKELDDACNMIRTRSHHVYHAFVLACAEPPGRKTLFRCKAQGEAAANKKALGEELDEKEEAARQFFVKMTRAGAWSCHLLRRQALCDSGVIIGRDPDTRDASGKVVKGKEHYADPKGAPQAWALLAMHPDYREVEVEEEEAPTTETEPTEADEEAFARAYLAKKGLPWPDAPGGYDPTSAAPANATK